MIDASQRTLRINSQGEELEGMSPPMKKHLELEIKILQNAPRDADKLRKLLQAKQRQKEEAMHIEDTQGYLRRLKCFRLYCFWCVEIEEEKKKLAKRGHSKKERKAED